MYHVNSNIMLLKVILLGFELGFLSKSNTKYHNIYIMMGNQLQCINKRIFMVQIQQILPFNIIMHLCHVV